MVKNKGSDLFITAGYPPAMKLDGKVTKLSDKPLSAEHTAQIARSIMDEKTSHRICRNQRMQLRHQLGGRVALSD